MTVDEWRNKHRKCKFCANIKYLTLPPNCIGVDTWCNAKMKTVNDEIPRPFCKLFTSNAKEDSHA